MTLLPSTRSRRPLPVAGRVAAAALAIVLAVPAGLARPAPARAVPTTAAPANAIPTPAAAAVSAVPTSAAAPLPVGPAEQVDAGEVTLRAIEQTPWVAREGTWSLQMEVGGAPPGAVVRADIHARLASTRDFDVTRFGVFEGGRIASIAPLEIDQGETSTGDLRVVTLAVSLRQPGASRPGWAFYSEGLRPGVYPVEVEVRSPPGPDGEGEVLRRTVTYLNRVPEGEELGADRSPLLVSTVLPVGGPPSLDAASGNTLSPDVIDDVLDVATGLAFTDDLPATLAPVPETVEALARQPEGAYALAALRAAAQDRHVLDAPYVDLPLTAWVARGLGDELGRQRERGNRVLTSHLGRVDSSTWRASAGLTPEAADALWPVGVRTVLLNPTAIDPVEEDPIGPVTLGAGGSRTLQAVVTDGRLGQLLVAPTDTADQRPDRVLNGTALAARLALVSAGRDEGVDGGVVLNPPVGWPEGPDDLIALGDVLLDPLAPVRAVTVRDLLDSVDDRSRRALRPVLVGELDDFPQHLGLARSRLGSYASLVGSGGSPEVATLDQRLLLSGAASLAPEDRRGFVDSVVSIIDRRLADIEAPTRQTITLTSSDADIPLTLRNALDIPVQVVIDLEVDTRVEIRDGVAQPDGTVRIAATLEPGLEQIEIPVHTRVPGDSPLDITIRTPDGAVVLDEVRYTVRSTAVSGIGIVLSIGASGFLLLWWARHWTRARRSRRDDRRHSVGGPAVQASHGP